MPIFAVAITKQVSFRGVQQEFSNVYHYNGVLPGASQADAIIDALKAIEVPFHATDVTFVRGKLWSAGGTAGQNVMISQKNLGGAGTQTVQSSMDRERAILVRFANGFDSRGRPKYLRKWYHSCGNFAGVSLASGGLQQNTSQISAVDRAAIVAAVTPLLSLTVNSILYNLVSPTGAAGGTPVICHPYLEHHQLGDMWR